MVMLKEIGLRYSGLDRLDDGGAIRNRFDLIADGILIGTLPVITGPTDSQTVDSQIAKAHRTLAKRLREWAASLDEDATALEGR